MKVVALLATLTVLAAATSATAQPAPAVFLQRLPLARLDIEPPASRVRGVLGEFTLQAGNCRVGSAANARRRMVDAVVQEWAFFGFSVADERDPASWAPRPRARQLNERDRRREIEEQLQSPEQRERIRVALDEATRVAPSIAGYWAVTSDGSWIVARHNNAWRESDGLVTRWSDPWSAAFISWVMCEAGFSNPLQFQRAIAHHTYIDQAIRARDGLAPEAVLVAHDMGEQPIVPGDLVCLARRPAYRSVQDRRSQMGVGARTHCDVVVKVDEDRQLLFAIGGNVRGTVGLKLLPAERRGGGPLRPVDRAAVVPGAATTFIHLQLRAEPIEATAFDTSTTVAQLACSNGWAAPAQVTAVGLFARAEARRC